jgi:hypothetical protein
MPLRCTVLVLPPWIYRNTAQTELLRHMMTWQNPFLPPLTATTWLPGDDAGFHPLGKLGAADL